MNAQRNKSGTTILIVIAILVVIAVIAVSLWRNHGMTERVDAALKGADAAKVAVMEAATVHGGLSGVKAGELGFNPAATTNPYVAKIAVADGGLITIVTRDTGITPDPQLLLTPTAANGGDQASIHWDCSVLVGKADSMPESCRHVAEPVSEASPAATAPAAPASVAAAHSSQTPAVQH
jgi:type IV pilus assembly protein PilA